MKCSATAWFPTLVLLANGAVAQDRGIEVERVLVDTIAIARPELRSLVVEDRLDRDHDQYLSLDEIDAGIAKAERDALHDARRQRLAHKESWFEKASSRPVNRCVLPPAKDDFLPKGDGGWFDCSPLKLKELQWARGQIVRHGGDELSLVAPDFHRRFADLPADQRNALMEADASGNNDGIVTVPEFYERNRRPFFHTSRFEADFGEQAYLDVLRLLGVLPAR